VTRSWFLSAALADVGEAFRWYEMQRPGLGEDFVDAVDGAVEEIVEHPEACPAFYRNARRCLLARFPYCLYYRVEAEGVIVVACMHAARDPERHRGRLRS
jgi:plasmid stabilization system protein ParE